MGWNEVYDYDYEDTPRYMGERYIEEMYLEEEREERFRNEARV